MHKLQLKSTFPYESRQRAGIRLLKGEALEVSDLTKEQLEALRLDEWITVTAVQDEKGQQPAAKKMVDKQSRTKKG